jgi:hypothetical protein
MPVADLELWYFSVRIPFCESDANYLGKQLKLSPYVISMSTGKTIYIGGGTQNEPIWSTEMHDGDCAVVLLHPRILTFFHCSSNQYARSHHAAQAQFTLAANQTLRRFGFTRWISI